MVHTGRSVGGWATAPGTRVAARQRAYLRARPPPQCSLLLLGFVRVPVSRQTPLLLLLLQLPAQHAPKETATGADADSWAWTDLSVRLWTRPIELSRKYRRDSHWQAECDSASAVKKCRRMLSRGSDI